MTVLLKTEFVLDLKYQDEDFSSYRYDLHEVVVPRDVFLYLGQPDQITVTIEPGDTLNADTT